MKMDSINTMHNFFFFLELQYSMILVFLHCKMFLILTVKY